MKRVRRVKGDLKERLKRDPVQAFDGIADHIDLPYGDRVIGVGDFRFAPTPRPMNTESTMAKLWENEAAQHADTTGEAEGSEHPPESEQDTHQLENGNVASSAETSATEGAASEAGIDPTAPPQMEDASVPSVVRQAD